MPSHYRTNLEEIIFMSPFREFLERIREYDSLVDIAEIARRYFAMNAFDGVLTIIGVLMGNLTARVEQKYPALLSVIW